MITKEKLARINALYHKQKKEGLTEEEKQEQSQLRQEYVKTIKQRVRVQLANAQQEDREPPS